MDNLTKALASVSSMVKTTLNLDTLFVVAEKGGTVMYVTQDLDTRKTVDTLLNAAWQIGMKDVSATELFAYLVPMLSDMMLTRVAADVDSVTATEKIIKEMKND